MIPGLLASGCLQHVYVSATHRCVCNTPRCLHQIHVNFPHLHFGRKSKVFERFLHQLGLFLFSWDIHKTYDTNFWCWIWNWAREPLTSASRADLGIRKWWYVHKIWKIWICSTCSLGVPRGSQRFLEVPRPSRTSPDLKITSIVKKHQLFTKQSP